MWWFALILACGPRDHGGTQIGAESGEGCVELERGPVADPTEPADGFVWSLDEALSALSGSFSGVEAGEEEVDVVSVRLTLTPVGEAELVRLEEGSSGGGLEPAMGALCSDLYSQPVDMRFVAEGLLDEAGRGVLSASELGDGSVSLQLDWAEVQGPAAPTQFDPAEMASTELTIYATWRQELWTGEASFGAESRPQGAGEDASVSYTTERVVSFQVGREAR